MNHNVAKIDYTSPLYLIVFVFELVRQVVGRLPDHLEIPYDRIDRLAVPLELVITQIGGIVMDEVDAGLDILEKIEIRTLRQG